MRTGKDLLASIEPTRNLTLRSLVEEAGVSTKVWGANRYDWCFGGSGQPWVLTVWHQDLVVEGAKVYLKADTSYERSDTSGNPRRLTRAHQFDSMIRALFETRDEARVVLVVGRPRPHSDQAVTMRRLDSARWRVVEYARRTGGFCLERATETE